MSKPRRIGLLFVHGIGQQERWEHLHSMASRLADLLREHPTRNSSVSIVDRTAKWEAKPGEPVIGSQSGAPLTIQYRPKDPKDAVDFECHEVWWADLGKRTGFTATVKFWFWGLGQWNAPIHAVRDPSKLSAANEDAQTAEPQGDAAQEVAKTDAPQQQAREIPAVHLPQSTTSGNQASAHRATRLSLAWAGTAASMIVVTFTLILRLLSFVTGKKASLDLVIDYMGDVEIYQQRGQPGGGAVSDPGQPRRVAIRRRMVTEMVAMGTRDYDSWSILAHSLGSVVAFNGIGEIGHALPNYCSEELWNALKAEPHKGLTQDSTCPLRTDPENMMPARPAWLEAEDCINKPKLFGNLTNFITYGSPLGTFAAIWPRIVAFEKGVGKRGVFADTNWINIVAPRDPVSCGVERFGRVLEGDKEHAGDLPKAVNLNRPTREWYGISHTSYFAGETPDQLRENAQTGQPTPYAGFYDDCLAQIAREKTKRLPMPDAEVDPLDHDKNRLWSSVQVTLGIYSLSFLLVGALLWAFGGSPPGGFQFFVSPGDSAFQAGLNNVLGGGLLLYSCAMAGVYFAGLIRNQGELIADRKDRDYELWVLENAGKANSPRGEKLKFDRKLGKQSSLLNSRLMTGSLLVLLLTLPFVFDCFYNVTAAIQSLPSPVDAVVQFIRPLLTPTLMLTMFWWVSKRQADMSAKDEDRRME